MSIRPVDVLLRVGISAALVVGGYFHADLYGRGYRYIHFIGPSFLVQAAVSFALAVLVLVGPWTMRLAAAGLAGGSLVAFALSRTTGIAGFSEIGWDPAPQAALSVAAEVITVILCAASLLLYRREAVRYEARS
ncbi:hypothetical protein DFR70_107114 [Nocardia tenerifensis]|uniref:Uncharacterized protein n=1 Tax=Nocardia tenerifensis TaxID=228006 RepID=A0A318JXB4_9NOCA|nr:hypothetical protein [Nocardia tenerifensis]PXX62247.1 hypothetical protein DFR70_107114 [Nocardia tenerifensis]